MTLLLEVRIDSYANDDERHVLEGVRSGRVRLVFFMGGTLLRSYATRDQDGTVRHVLVRSMHAPAATQVSVFARLTQGKATIINLKRLVFHRGAIVKRTLHSGRLLIPRNEFPLWKGAAHTQQVRVALQRVFLSMLSCGVVAGGVLLACAHGDYHANRDVDVYMTQTKFAAFVDALTADLGAGSTAWVLLSMSAAVKYIYTGMASNVQGILFHVALRVPLVNLIVDVVVVDDPVEAIEGFDFTFCQAGLGPVEDSSVAQWPPSLATRDVMLLHPHDTISKHGTITRPFVREYALGNRTTLRRIQKYASRGYTLSMRIEDMRAVEADTGAPVPFRAPASFFSNERLQTNRDAVPPGIRLLRLLTCKAVFKTGPRALRWIARRYTESPPQQAGDYLLAMLREFPQLKKEVDPHNSVVQLSKMRVRNREAFLWPTVAQARRSTDDRDGNRST